MVLELVSQGQKDYLKIDAPYLVGPTEEATNFKAPFHTLKTLYIERKYIT